MAHGTTRRLTGTSAPAWRDAQAVDCVNVQPLLEALDLQVDAVQALAGDLPGQIAYLAPDEAVTRPGNASPQSRRSPDHRPVPMMTRKENNPQHPGSVRVDPHPTGGGRR